MILHRPRALTYAAIIVLAAAAAVLATPLPAAAAGELQLSSDGVHWGNDLAGPLFAVNAIVPGDAETSVFYVRNTSGETGHMRIALKDVVVDDEAFAAALTLRVSTPGHAGTATPIVTAQPCMVVTERATVPAGGTIAVTTELALADLTGTDGQNASAAFALRVALGQSPSTAAPTHCDATGATVPGLAPPAAAPARVGAPGDRPTSPGAPAFQPGAIAVVAPPAPSAPQEPVNSEPATFFIDPNTGNLNEELVIFVLAAAFLSGAALLLLGARRRRAEDDENDGFAKELDPFL